MGYYIEDSDGNRIDLDAGTADEAIAACERMTSYEDIGEQTVDIYHDGDDEPVAVGVDIPA